MGKTLEELREEKRRLSIRRENAQEIKKIGRERKMLSRDIGELKRPGLTRARKGVGKVTSTAGKTFADALFPTKKGKIRAAPKRRRRRSLAPVRRNRKINKPRSIVDSIF